MLGGEDFEDDHGEGVDIGLVRDALALEHFGSHPAERADGLVGRRLQLAAEGLAAGGVGQAPIADLSAPVFGDENVGSAQVAMVDALAVRIGHAEGDIAHQTEGHVGRQFDGAAAAILVVNELLQVAPMAPLQHQADVRPHHAGAVQLDDVGVVQLRHQVDLVLDHVCVAQLPVERHVQPLDCHVPALVVAAEHLAEVASPYQLVQDQLARRNVQLFVSH